MREQVVGPIAGGDTRGRRAGALEGVGQHERAQHGFDGPAFRDESLGEVIEQFGVGGLIAETPEVIDGADEATSKGVVPEPVDHHAGRQRVVRGTDFRGQFEPPASGRIEGFYVEDFEEASGDGFGGLAMVAADVEGLVEARSLPEPWGTSWSRQFGFQPPVLCDEFGQSR